MEQKKLLIGSCLPYSVIAGIITNSVLEIESGSLETVDRLVRKGFSKAWNKNFLSEEQGIELSFLAMKGKSLQCQRSKIIEYGWRG